MGFSSTQRHLLFPLAASIGAAIVSSYCMSIPSSHLLCFQIPQVMASMSETYCMSIPYWYILWFRRKHGRCRYKYLPGSSLKNHFHGWFTISMVCKIQEWFITPMTP
ncbi:hypothetical protein A2U01_0021790 [Trifolium medium]|uniref:Uncharacterized protein n=1 Tax=Trifolium medium TaxID=97028 RepID=A0A392NLL2_9FABA|nr:hypothetical protein [Trifolium medium]